MNAGVLMLKADIPRCKLTAKPNSHPKSCDGYSHVPCEDPGHAFSCVQQVDMVCCHHLTLLHTELPWSLERDLVSLMNVREEQVRFGCPTVASVSVGDKQSSCWHSVL